MRDKAGTETRAQRLLLVGLQGGLIPVPIHQHGAAEKREWMDGFSFPFPAPGCGILGDHLCWMLVPKKEMCALRRALPLWCCLSLLQRTENA